MLNTIIIIYIYIYMSLTKEIELEQNKKDIAANNLQLAISNENINIEQLKYALQELQSLKPNSILLEKGFMKLLQLAISNENIEQLKYALGVLEPLKPDSILLGKGYLKLDELKLKKQQEKEAKEKEEAAIVLEIALYGKNIETLQSAINEYERVHPNKQSKKLARAKEKLQSAQEKLQSAQEKAAIALENALDGNNIETLQRAINEYERVNEPSRLESSINFKSAKEKLKLAEKVNKIYYQNREPESNKENCDKWLKKIADKSSVSYSDLLLLFNYDLTDKSTSYKDQIIKQLDGSLVEAQDDLKKLRWLLHKVGHQDMITQKYQSVLKNVHCKEGVTAINSALVSLFKYLSKNKGGGSRLKKKYYNTRKKNKRRRKRKNTRRRKRKNTRKNK